MNRRWLAVALAALAAGQTGAWAAHQPDLTPTQDVQQEAAKFDDWAKGRISALKADIARLDTRLVNGNAPNKERDRRELAELKGRVEELELRLKEPRAEATRDASKDRREIRARIEKLDKQISDLEKRATK